MTAKLDTHDLLLQRLADVRAICEELVEEADALTNLVRAAERQSHADAIEFVQRVDEAAALLANADI
jgi:hypothetical protein